jgi:hypothetical protein
MKNSHNILVGEPEWEKSLGRPRRRWKVIRMDLGEIRWKGVDWMHLADDTD